MLSLTVADNEMQEDVNCCRMYTSAPDSSSQALTGVNTFWNHSCFFHHQG